MRVHLQKQITQFLTILTNHVFFINRRVTTPVIPVSPWYTFESIIKRLVLGGGV